MPSKKKTQASHARKRIFERYGTSLSKHHYNELCHILKRNYGKILAKQSNTRSIRSIEYNGTVFYIIYDKLRCQIATFLTKEMAEETAKHYNLSKKGTNHVEISCSSL